MHKVNAKCVLFIYLFSYIFFFWVPTADSLRGSHRRRVQYDLTAIKPLSSSNTGGRVGLYVWFSFFGGERGGSFSKQKQQEQAVKRCCLKTEAFLSASFDARGSRSYPCVRKQYTMNSLPFIALDRFKNYPREVKMRSHN